jgi:hypothetical protein
MVLSIRKISYENDDLAGVGDLEEDVRLFRDIEIRLKIEPLSIKLIHSITERIRTHVHAQGKLALSNLVGILYQ